MYILNLRMERATVRMDWAAMRIEVLTARAELLTMRTELLTARAEEVIIGAHPVSNKGELQAHRIKKWEETRGLGETFGAFETSYL